MLKHTAPGGGAFGRAVRLPPRPPQPLSATTLHHSLSSPPKLANGSTPRGAPPSCSQQNISSCSQRDRGVREALTSLGLLCLVSLLLALLSLIFLLKISPGGREPPPPPGPAAPEDYAVVYDVTLALCALSLSLNLCCLLVCAIQFLFAVKLVRTTTTTGRGNKYLQKSSASRVCAVGGFFVSIPVFLTGIILYTFTQFHSTPAIVTSVLIGVGILFCGGAMVHNVFVWQREKTISVRHPHMRQTSSPSPTPTPFGGNISMQSIISPKDHNNSGAMYLNHSHHTLNQSIHTLHPANSPHTPVTHLTPVTPNVSHMGFNLSYVPPYIRAATATPPTPKTGALGLVSSGTREASGSISPGLPQNAALDLSSGGATNSPHELSTLV